MLNYNQKTGILSWKKAKSNRVKENNVVGSLSSNGGLVIGFNGKTYLVHRVIWLYVYGYMPKLIDHINGDRTDNRLCNLREADYAKNNQNAKLSKTNTTGVKNIHIDKRTGKWCVQVRAFGIKKHFGVFSDFFEACCCAFSTRNRLHKEFANHGNTK